MDGGVRSSREHSSSGQARDDSATRRGLARRGKRADDAEVGPTYGSVAIDCAVAAAACNKHTTQEGNTEF